MQLSFQHRLTHSRRPRVHIVCQVETGRARPVRTRIAQVKPFIKLAVGMDGQPFARTSTQENLPSENVPDVAADSGVIRRAA